MIGYIIGFFALLVLYNEFNFFLIKRRVKQPAKLMKGAEPFFYKKGKIGVLLIHGFTSSPKEFREFGKYLSKKNISVFAPLLPGHGTAPERLAFTKWYDWIEEVNHGVNMLSKHCSKIYLVGNSMGGNLALLCSSHKKIKGVITLGAPITLRHHRKSRILLPLLKRIKLFQKKNYSKLAMKKSIQQRRTSYMTIPLRSVGHLLKIISMTKKQLPFVKKPLLIMHTKQDGVADDVSAYYIYEHAASKKKELVWVKHSYHVFIIDKHRGKTFEQMYSFIKKTK